LAHVRFVERASRLHTALAGMLRRPLDERKSAIFLNHTLLPIRSSADYGCGGTCVGLHASRWRGREAATKGQGFILVYSGF
jgi:hypothetical protein